MAGNRLEAKTWIDKAEYTETAMYDTLERVTRENIGIGVATLASRYFGYGAAGRVGGHVSTSAS